MAKNSYLSRSWRNCLCSAQKNEQRKNTREGEMLSVVEQTKWVLHKEQKLVVLHVKKNFVLHKRFELAVWGKNKTKHPPTTKPTNPPQQSKPPNLLIERTVGTSYERRQYKSCHWNTGRETSVLCCSFEVTLGLVLHSLAE